MHALIVKVTMAHKPTIEAIASIFGVGSISVEIKPHKNHREAWSWVCRSDDAAYVLYLINPWLVTKKQECLTALEFQRLPKARAGRNKVPIELLEIREKYYWELRGLKGMITP